MQTQTTMTQTKIAEAIEKIGGPMIGGADAARALRDTAGLVPAQIAVVLASEAGLGLDAGKIARALYFSDGLDLDANAVADALAKSKCFNAEQIAAALHSGLGLGLERDAAVAAMRPVFSADEIAGAFYEMGDGPTPSITRGEIADALANAGLKTDEIVNALDAK